MRTKSKLNPRQRAIHKAAEEFVTIRHAGKRPFKRQMDPQARLMCVIEAGRAHGVFMSILGAIDSMDAVHLLCYDAEERTHVPWHSEIWPHIYHKHWRIYDGTRLETISWTPDEEEREKVFDKSLKAAITYLTKKLS